MSVNTPYISIVSPVYRAADIVPILVKNINESLVQITNDFEIVLVDDGSPDTSWEAITHACYQNKRVKGVKLSRNFGQHYAITAGLEKAGGEILILMDCDMQDDPSHISKLIQRKNEGFDVVFTRRKSRKHGFFKSLAGKVYNFCFYLFADSSYDVNLGSLTLLTKRVRNEFMKIGDKDRLYIQLLKWVGFKSTFLEVEHRERISGESTYTLSKLFSLAIQGWTSHSTKLLKLTIYFGFGLAILALLTGIAITILKFVYGFQTGWASIIVTILFSTGLIQISIGILGVYIGKTFDQSKNRPLYIIEETLNV